jgi:hypothetical protein
MCRIDKRRTNSLFDPGGNENCGHANTEPIKLEVEGVWANNAVGIGDAGDRGWYVVVEAAVFVIGEEKGGLIPLGAGAESLVDLLDEALAAGDIMGGVVVIGREELAVKVALLDDDVVGEAAKLGMELEGEGVVVELGDVLELAQGLEEEGGGDVLVVDTEAEAVLVERVEDGLLGEAVDEVLAHIGGEAVGRGGVHVEAVGLGGGGDGGKPPGRQAGRIKWIW